MTIRVLLSLALLITARPAVGVQSEPEAVRLLREALKPARVAYAGKLSVLREGAKRPRKVNVWYLPGGRLRRDLPGPKGSIARSVIADGTSVWFYDRIRKAAWKGGPRDAEDGSWPIAGKELDLLIKNYSVRLLPKTIRVAKRLCRIVEVASPQGRPLRQLWVDQEYGLPLEVRAYGPDGSIASSFRFIRVEFGLNLNEDLFRFSPPAGTEIIPSRRRPNYLDLEQWVYGERNPILPRWIPQGFELESSDITLYRGARVLHSRYSDGVEAFSFFQCPDKVRLAPPDAPMSRLELGAGGHAELAEGVQWPGETVGSGARLLQWRLHHRRFILVGRLPVETMKRMAESLP